MLEKNYNPKDFEEKIYADWENSGDFKPDMRRNALHSKCARRQRGFFRRYSAAERYRIPAHGARP